MHFLQLGEADAPAGQPFDPSPEIQVLALYLLGVALADLMPAHVQVAPISAPVVRKITADVERRKQRLQVLEHRVRPLAKPIGQHGVGTLKGINGIVNGVPQPALV